MAEIQNHEFLKTAEAAARLRVPPANLRRLVARGVLPIKPIRIGNVFRWPAAAIDALARGEAPVAKAERGEQ